MSDWKFLNKARRGFGTFGSRPEDGFNGLFEFQLPEEPRRIRVIASDSKEWIRVKSFEGLYEVSNYGEVRTLERSVPLPNNASRLQCQRTLSCEVMDKGYRRVSLSKNGETIHKLVHVIVAEAFIHKPEFFTQVNHRNGNKGDNMAPNLEWCTEEYNHHHAIENGLRSGLSAKDILKIKEMLESGNTTQEIADTFERSRQTISDIKAGRHRDLNPEQPSRYSGVPLWQHVSVSFGANVEKTPSWKTMCLIKDLFFEPEDVVIQFHPAKSMNVNNHPGCLHLWRCTDGREQPMPSKWLVGIPGLEAMEIMDGAIEELRRSIL